VIISSGFGRLFIIIGPPFPKHSAGPVQMGRLIIGLWGFMIPHFRWLG
jgi:hypothetical protein